MAKVMNVSRLEGRDLKRLGEYLHSVGGGRVVCDLDENPMEVTVFNSGRVFVSYETFVNVPKEFLQMLCDGGDDDGK